jgi:hypothetical protein
MFSSKAARISIFSIGLALIFCGCHGATKGSGKPLKLAAQGRTDYKIVVVENGNPIDSFAAAELQGFLKKITGVEFQSVKASSPEAAQKTPRIFLGWSPVSAETFGDKNALDDLKDQECSVISKGADLFLQGKGKYGNLNAVYEFLENQLGCRWYTAYGDMQIPRRPDLEIGPVNSTVKIAFPVRSLMTFFYSADKKKEASLYHYRNRQNILLMESPGVEEILRTFIGCHSLSTLIPPGGDIPRLNKAQEWLPNKKYFATNPEFFSLDESGKRVPNRQLCFSNPALRAELTKNVLEQMRRSQLLPINQGRPGIVSIDTNDIAYNMCCCPDCKKLQDQYKSPGGPLFDYVIELCAYMEKHHPEIKVEMSAYNETLTEIPPDIRKMPDNLIVIFAPINASFAAPFSDPINAKALKNLKGWNKICSNVWVWYYPNPYNYTKELFVVPPSANLYRIVDDIKTLNELGVTGAYFEHDSGVPYCANFTELQSWLMLRLFQNPYQDINPLITEFTDFYYGKAAPAAREYLFELEKLNQELMQKKLYRHCQAMDFPYLTPENIKKWSAMFDQMEAVTADDPERNFHVRLARLGLDSAAVKILGQTDKISFASCSKRLARTFHELCEKRRPGEDKGKIDKWLAEMGQRIPAKDIPEEFKTLGEGTAVQVSPDYRRLNPKTVVKDSAANLGAAVFEETDGKDFPAGFYDAFNKKYGSSRTIRKSDIEPDVYKLYKLNGAVKLSPECLIWGGKWLLSVNLGQLCPADDPQAMRNEWEVYVSLKFEGPAYSEKSAEKPNRVFCDRVILVKVNNSKKDKP